MSIEIDDEFGVADSCAELLIVQKPVMDLDVAALMETLAGRAIASIIIFFVLVVGVGEDDFRSSRFFQFRDQLLVRQFIKGTETFASLVLGAAEQEDNGGDYVAGEPQPERIAWSADAKAELVPAFAELPEFAIQ